LPEGIRVKEGGDQKVSIAGLDTVKMTGSELTTPKAHILGRDDFLYLLITQLKSQDPLKPMESTEFTAQLAQFSSLEQLQNINENLRDLRVSQASLNNSQALSFIGRTVKAAGNSIHLSDGVSDDIRFELGGDAVAVFVNIYDSAGNLVKRLGVGPLRSGEQSIRWDGTDNEGNNVPDGVYTFEVLAVSADNEAVDVKTFTIGRITGVTFKNGTAYLLAGNKEIPVSSVIRVLASEQDEKMELPKI